MSTENSLVIFSRASQMLAEATTIQKAKELKDLAFTAADWAKRKGLSKEAEQYARSYGLEAERRLGQLLAATELNPGTRPSKEHGGTMRIPPSISTLSDLGLTKRESAQAQQLSEMPEAVFAEIKTGAKTRTQVKREALRDKIKTKTRPLPNDKYRIFYADPPWKYGDQLTENYGATKYHYESMTIAELCALPIKELAEENAVLFLWVTSPILPECFEVIKAWGFQYKASFIWDKVKHNMGHYNSVRHEFLLICTRGLCLPDEKELIDSVQVIERSQKHSEKPEEFRKIIDRLYTHGKRIELFARTEAENWERWGNE